MRIDLIANPRAGRRSQDLRRALSDVGGRLGESRLHFTTRPEEAKALASRALEGGSDLVIAAGGDGTVNEVASILVGTGTPFGVLPTGSGNGLARVLGISRDPATGLRALAGGEVRPMDVGLINGEPFFNVAGVGLDAEIGLAFQNRGNGSGPRGLSSYVELGLKHLMNHAARSFTLETDSGSIEGRAVIVAFANGRQYGGGAVIAPKARLDDGLLDLVVLEEASLLEIFGHAPKLFLGGIETYPAYKHLAASRAVVTMQPAANSHRDGEPGALCPSFEVAVASGALQVVVPARTLRDPMGPFAESDRGTAFSSNPVLS